MSLKHIVSPLLLVVGLGFWTLAPYGGCSCRNPLDSSAGPTPTPTPTQGPFVDDWEDNDFLNKWGGSAMAFKDNYATTMAYSIAAEGSDLAGGTPGRSIRVVGNIDSEVPAMSKYPYVQIQIGLNGERNMLTDFSSFNGVRFSYRWGRSPIAPGSSFFVIAATPITVTDFAWFRHQIFPSNNSWNSVSVYFPDKTGSPLLAQPTWGVPRPWASSPFSGSVLSRIDFAVQPTASAYDYDLYIDDVTFF